MATRSSFEKLGREDLCPCGSGRRFQELLPQERPVRRITEELLPARVSRVPRTRSHLIRWVNAPSRILRQHPLLGGVRPRLRWKSAMWGLVGWGRLRPTVAEYPENPES